MFVKPTSIAIIGFPTSGKTTLGRALAKATGIHFLDYEQLAACALPPAVDLASGTPEILERERGRMGVVYQVGHAVVEGTLRLGESVIIALPYASVPGRQYLAAAVQRGCGVLKLVHVVYDVTPDELARRVAAKGLGPEWVPYHWPMLARFQEIEGPHITVRMEGGEEGTQAAVKAALKYIEE